MITTKTYHLDYVFTHPKFLARIKKLTLNPNSGMNFELNSLAKISMDKKIDAKALCLYENSELIAWALVSNEKSNYWFSIQQYRPDKGTLFEVFVAPIHRRKGYGSILLNKARKLYKNLCIAPWDPRSDKFYKSNHYEADVHLAKTWEPSLCRDLALEKMFTGPKDPSINVVQPKPVSMN